MTFEFFILHFKLICLIWFPPGVRPKLSHPSILAGSVGTLSPSRNMRFDDFLIIEKRAAESQVFHLFGIESPGLTSSLGIAQYISSNIYWSRHDKAWIPHTMCQRNLTSFSRKLRTTKAPWASVKGPKHKSSPPYPPYQILAKRCPPSDSPWGSTKSGPSLRCREKCSAE